VKSNEGFHEKVEIRPEISHTVTSQPNTQENIMKLNFGRALALAIALLASAALLYAQDAATTAAKDTGHATKVAAKDTAHATKVAAKDTAKSTDKAADKTAKGSDDVAHDTAHGVKKAGKAVGHGVKKGAVKTADAVK
jgi:hypothetical protein